MTKKHDIIWLDSVDSTNEEARRRISAIDNLSVVSAHTQTAGRGQRGNTWCSNPGENLTFSIIIKYEKISAGSLPAHDQFVISALTSLSVTDFLAQKGIKAKVKWPNDIYVDSKKICGILIENSLFGNLMSTSIIGIGLNINQIEFNIKDMNPTSMRLETGQDYDTAHCLDEFMNIFKSYIDRYIRNYQESASLLALYTADLWRKDEFHLYNDIRQNIIFKGKIRGISDTGLLKVENEEGELNEFAFKEISYII